MSWSEIRGHAALIDRFRLAHARGRLGGTYLFVGPAGVGKRTFALMLARALLCSRAGATLDPCDRCDSCAQVRALSHPDLDIVARPPEKSMIPVDLLIGPPEKRMQEGLCHRIGFKPMMGGRKLAIIDDADFLGEEGANALLKTLEEPPPRAVMILIGTSADKQLPTIRSRAQLIRFEPLAQAELEQLLVEKELVPDAATARNLAQFSEGSLARAEELADEGLFDFRRQLWQALSAPRLPSVSLAAEAQRFVDAAGKEAPLRRRRLRQLILFAIEYYRALLRAGAGAAREIAPELARLVSASPLSPLDAAACIQRSLEALDQIDRNVNLATLIDAWLDELHRATT